MCNIRFVMTKKKERMKGGQNQNDRPSNAENECSCSCALDKQVINTELYVCICMDECLIGSDGRWEGAGGQWPGYTRRNWRTEFYYSWFVSVCIIRSRARTASLTDG